VTAIDRESTDIEALRTDRYLEALLADTGRAAPGTRATDAPMRSDGLAGATDPAVRVAAAHLRRGVQRMHPSFRFEERLAERLTDLAATMRTGAGGREVGAGALVLPFPFRPGDDPAGDDAAREPGARLPRPVLIGGAVASAAISIAGAAFVAWRLGRPADPLTRAARVAQQLRVVAPGGVGPGGLG
jgi:hypothetical protein